MTLRCFLFSSDEETAAVLRRILSNLGIEGEFCANAVTAAERITNQAFQIVVIDWDQQPEAGLLLGTAQERKAAERPLTLAIVSNDLDAPKALHAGANSLLRKPVIANQARDTLTTARDLLAAKHGFSPVTGIATQGSAPIPELNTTADGDAIALRADDLPETAALNPVEPGASVPQLPEEFALQAVRPVLREPEPITATGANPEEAPAPASKLSGTRGLEWYLKHKIAAGTGANSGAGAAAAAAPISPASPEKADLLGYNQAHSYSNAAGTAEQRRTENLTAKPAPKVEPTAREQRKEAELFAYIQGERPSPSHRSSSSFQFPKRALVPALILAAIAVIAAPQAPWHAGLQGSLRNANHALHVWLNPQPQTPASAPVAHETFTRAGDEYKLPVAEQIPDATTDPSQIQVVPVTDPTIKKTNPEGGNTMDPSAIPVDKPAAGTGTSADSPTTPGPEAQSATANPDPFRPSHPAQPTVSVIETPVISHISSAPADTSPVVRPAPTQVSEPRAAMPSGTIPPSLKSQLAPSNTSVISNKPLDAVAPAIEPVEVPENTERALIADSPPPVYPNNAKGQQGTVVLQVLVARDGTVQDTKFMQGSLLFARNAIDTVKLWKFKPYILNGRPVSVQTQLTIRFKPAQ